MRLLFVAESDAAAAIEARLARGGNAPMRVTRDALAQELAGVDDVILVLAMSFDAARATMAEVRGIESLASTPILAVTSEASAAKVAKLFERGVDEHVSWPAEEALIDARLRALDERVTLRKRLAESSRAEAELRTSEERLRTLIDLATDFIFIKDRGGRYVLLNPAGARSLGLTPEEVVGKSDLEVFGEETGRDVIDSDRMAMKSRKPIHYEDKRRIGNEERAFTTSKFAYVSPVGDLLGIAGITRDVTDLKRAEEAEKRRTDQRIAHQAALLALAHIDSGDFATDVEKILDVGADTLSVARVSFWSLSGDPPTVVSRSMRGTSSGSWANGFELRARHIPRYFETLTENRVLSLDDALAATAGTPLAKQYLEPNAVRAVLDAPVWLRGSLTGAVCLEHVGAPRAWTAEEADFAARMGHMVSMAIGDRDRDRAASELRRSESRMRTLIERLPDAVLVVRDGKVVFANDAFACMVGHAKAPDVVGTRFRDVVHAEDNAEATALETGSRSPRKIRFLRRDGEVVFAEVAGLTLVFDGEPATVAIARDLTDRNRLEAQLLLADRMVSVGTLAAGVAHEINNPLGYVLGNLTILQNGLSLTDSPDLKQSLQDAVHGAKRVREIVQDLQTFSRGDSGKAPQPVDVLRVMDVSIRMAYTALRHRAQLERDYSEVPAALGTESRLGQVFLNLLVNAAQAMPDRPLDDNRVKVTIRRDGEWVAVEISDNGVGMTDDVKKRLFDPFFTTKAIGEGTGLGLSICHSIVTSLGGSIEVESEPGVGSLLRVRVPTTREVPKVSHAEELAPQSTERRERVLVIDDEPMIGVMIRRLLAAHCDVLPVTSPREALRRIAAGERFDCVLCDLMMPRMNGMEFFAELTAARPDLAARTGFLTGGAVTTQARKFLQDHADRYLEKPVELGKLRAFVHQLALRTEVAPAPKRRASSKPRPA